MTRRGKPSTWTGMAALICTLSGSGGTLVGQEPGDSARDVTPNSRFEASGLQRFFVGDLNRDLWSLPFTAPYLDLSEYAGGLTPLRRGGGLQTRSLRLRGADGVTYNFRSVDKDATRTLDPALRQALPARVLQDQVGALFPLSAMVVAPLLKAADVLHADPTLVVMPDDPALGEFREDFAGLLGWIEVRPDEGPDGEPGFAGSTRVTGSPRLLERLENSHRHSVDAEAYLRARLMDVFVGDWDRHPDQWRWAGFDDGNRRTRWLPIPRDRDWALAKLDGLLVYVAGELFPHYNGFGREYPDVFNATFSGRALDRRILPRLSREDFAAVAEDLRGALTDAVIRGAVERLPDVYQASVGDDLVEAFTYRRDHLVGMADDFYLLLSEWTDLYATDEDNVVQVIHDGMAGVRVAFLDDDGTPWLERRFSPDETKEVRLFLHGGEDRTVVTGPKSPIIVRVIGGGGDDSYTVESDGDTRIYDHRGDNQFGKGPNTQVDERDWDEPPDQYSATHQAKARDWGGWGIGFPIVSFTSDVGLYAGVGVRHDTFGFRHHPYRSRLTATATFGPSVGRARGTVDWDLPSLFPTGRMRISASASSKEFHRFFGFGNETEEVFDDDFYKFTRHEVTLDVMAEWSGDLVTGAIGPTLRVRGEEDDADRRFIGEDLPYGSGGFTTAGLTGRLTLDGLDHAVAPRKGWHVAVESSVFPGVLSPTEGFGIAEATLSAFQSADEAPFRPLIGVRVGGATGWGTLPYHDAPSIGGNRSVLAHREGRFRGENAVFANGILSLELTDFFFLLPGRIGVHGVAESGRVWVDGESSTTWHSGVGGGVWLSFLNDHTMISGTIMNSSERTGFFFGLGWPF